MCKSYPGMVAIIGFLILTTPAEAVTTFQRTYGGTGYFRGRSVLEAQDGGYIVAGSTGSPYYECSDVYLIRIDAAGDTLWTRTYGGNQSDEVSSLQMTQDGGYIIAGWTNSFGVEVDTMGDEPYYYSDVYLIRTDAAGDTIWTKTYGGIAEDTGSSVLETQDRGYIIAGTTRSFGAGDSDVYLIKTDADGDTLWTQTYGGSDSDWGSSIIETQDGGYIIEGSTRSFGAESDGIYLIKTDAAGDTLWTKTYGGSDPESGSSVQETQDGGFIIVGEITSFGTGNTNVYLIRTDAAGDTLWTRTYGGSDSESGSSVQETQDGGFIIVGETTSFSSWNTDVYLIRTDAAGDTLWTQTYGGVSSEKSYSVQETQDGGYIFAGWTTSFDADSMAVFIVKTDSQGNTSLQIAGFGWREGTHPMLDGMEFVSIPSGKFMMGSSSSESGRSPNESQHRVYINSFELMTTEVTQGIWEEVMETTVDEMRSRSDYDSGLSGVGSDYPMYYISWNDCQNFIDKLSDLDPYHTYRLPSEAEWEYACRAGTTTAYYWGNSDSENVMGRYCWYKENSDQSSHPVSTKEPNDWGLYDMIGNVEEQCQDAYTSDYDDCPADGSAYIGFSYNCRVARGGSMYGLARMYRSAFRGDSTLGPDKSFKNLGFRLVRFQCE